MSAPDAVMHLIRLRAKMIRLANEIEYAADHVTGKGGPRARAEVGEVARQIRAAAMAPDLVAICERKNP